MIEIAPCPVCRELDDCEHRLVEWYGGPGERIRGSLCPLLKRMEQSIARAVVECCLAGVRPREPGLQDVYDSGCAAIEWIRDRAAEPHKDEDAWGKAYWGAEIDADEVWDEVAGDVTGFVIGCLRTAPGVTTVVNESPVVAHPEPCDYVSLFAADPVAVRQHLLDQLAPIEVQGDQLRFERRGAGRG